jgi:hypothetical protein
MWLQAAFPASLSASQANEPEQTTNETCGPQPLALYKPYGQPTLFSKMSQDSCPLGTLAELFKTWPKAGMTLDGAFYPQPNWERRINEIGSGFWLSPTVKQIGASEGRREKRTAFRESIGRKDAPGSLEEQVQTPKMWPTPRSGKTTDEDEASWMARYEAGKVSTPPLTLAVKMWPTPQARDQHTIAKVRRGANSPGGTPLSVAAYESQPTVNPRGGSLNPTWVEWLMGWPLGWTDLERSVTDRFRQWRQQHGGC